MAPQANQHQEGENEGEDTNTHNSDLEDEYQSITALDSSHPLYLHPSDHPGQTLVAAALTGENFNEWHISMSLALSAKNKLGLVTGKYKKPDETSVYVDHWQRCNDMVITWLLNSIIPEIRSSLVYIPVAADVWHDLHTRFSQSNGPRIFELKKALTALTQEAMTVSTYYTKFKMLWDDLTNASNPPKCTCVCSCKAKQQLHHHEEIMKVTQFLMGLNDIYTNIRGQILMMSPMPQLNQVLSLLYQEEKQRSCVNSSLQEIEAAALAFVMEQIIPEIDVFTYMDFPTGTKLLQEGDHQQIGGLSRLHAFCCCADEGCCEPDPSVFLCFIKDGITIFVVPCPARPLPPFIGVAVVLTFRVLFGRISGLVISLLATGYCI